MKTWADLDRAARWKPAALTLEAVPLEPGVYAWYRDGERKYVGTASSLRKRLWRNHLGKNRYLHGSAFRRNVAEHLGYGTSALINSRTVILTEIQLAKVRSWIMGCEVAWLTCRDRQAALDLETALKKEFRPKLTKR